MAFELLFNRDNYPSIKKQLELTPKAVVHTFQAHLWTDSEGKIQNHTSKGAQYMGHFWFAEYQRMENPPEAQYGESPEAAWQKLEECTMAYHDTTFRLLVSLIETEYHYDGDYDSYEEDVTYLEDETLMTTEEISALVSDYGIQHREPSDLTSWWESSYGTDYRTGDEKKPYVIHQKQGWLPIV